MNDMDPVKAKIIGGDPCNGSYLCVVKTDGVGEIFTLSQEGVILHVLDGRFQDVGSIVAGSRVYGDISMFVASKELITIGSYDRSSGTYVITPCAVPGRRIDRRETIQMHPLDFLIEKWLEKREREEE